MLGIKNRLIMQTRSQQRLHVLVAHVSCPFRGATFARGIKTGGATRAIMPGPGLGLDTEFRITQIREGTSVVTKIIPVSISGSGTHPKVRATRAKSSLPTTATSAKKTTLALNTNTTKTKTKGSGTNKSRTAASKKSVPDTLSAASTATLSTPTRTTKKLASSSRQKSEKTTKRSVRQGMTLSSASPLRSALEPSVTMMPPLSTLPTLSTSSLQDLGHTSSSSAKLTASSQVEIWTKQFKTEVQRSPRCERSELVKSSTTSEPWLWKEKNAPYVASRPSRSLLKASLPSLTTEATFTSAVQDQEPLPFLDFRTNESREVMYTKSEEEADHWLASNRTKMWALDAEWKPFGGYKQQGKIALVQLGDDKTVYLFHVIHMRQFPKELARILENKQILKVGINIKADGIKIFKDWGVACASLVELGAVSIQVQDDLVSKRRVRSMETLTRELLGHSVEKVGITRMGNWESRNLTANQIAYAANDAFVTYEVAERIKELQRQRPDQKFTLSLATVHTQGSTILEVRGTLQERQDRAATAADIVETIQAKNTFIPGVRENNRFRLPWTASSTFSKAMTSWGSKVTAKTASEPFRLGVRQEQSPSSSATTSTISRSPSSRTSTSSMSSTKSVSAATPTFTYHPPTEDPHFYSKSWSDEIRTMTKGGGKTIVTIIPPRLQIPRSFCTLTRRNLFVATELVCKNTPSPAGAASSSSTKEEEKETKPSRSEGDIYFPGQLLPESLEGKNILERNQAVWLEAGGRQDLSEDRDDGEKDDGDWHMNQNQALFASLMSHHSHENDSDGGKEST